jgi:hypothetical protein
LLICGGVRLSKRTLSTVCALLLWRRRLLLGGVKETKFFPPSLQRIAGTAVRVRLEPRAFLLVVLLARLLLTLLRGVHIAFVGLLFARLARLRGSCASRAFVALVCDFLLLLVLALLVLDLCKRKLVLRTMQSKVLNVIGGAHFRTS